MLRCCGQLYPVGRLPTGEIERTVTNRPRPVFRLPELMAGTWKAARPKADDITEADACTALKPIDALRHELFAAGRARIDA